MNGDANSAGPSLIGHEAARAVFAQALHTGRLHHAWMIHGAAGIGKTSFAFSCARLLLDGEDRAGRNGRQITAGTHPSLLSIARKIDEKRKRLRQEIVMDDVRPIQTFLHHTAAASKWRIVIVDAAETLNRSAANGLLKLLEEPPVDTVFFLTSPSPGAVLPTIRSRCRLLKLDPLSDEETATVLRQHGYTGPELAAMTARAAGAPGRVINHDGGTDRAAQSLSDDILRSERIDPDAVAALLRHDDGFATLCSLLGEALANRARELAMLGELQRARQAADAFSALQALRRETERFNLDKNQAVRQAATIASAP